MGRYVFQKGKIDCPHCGDKKRYSLYLDTESGELMSPEYGRCDRINSCGYFKYPNFGQAKVFQANFTPPVQQVYIDKKYVEGCMVWYDKNPFTKCLISKFGEQAREVLYSYYIGTTKALGTIFWCINGDMVCTSGKVITYVEEDTKDSIAPFRDKSRHPYYPYKKDDGYFPCFFGQHLVKKDSILWIVESEKTAILCALKWPDFTWISAGGAGGAGVAKVKALKDSGFKGIVNIMPDADTAGREASGRWVANFDSYGYKCEIHDLGQEYQNGEDYADMILLEHKESGK